MLIGKPKPKTTFIYLYWMLSIWRSHVAESIYVFLTEMVS